MSQTVLQPSFAGGEMSPELGRRVDLQKYAVSAQKIQNMYVLPRGGVRSRTGTTHIAETKYSAKPSRLVEFTFSVTQSYILEFGDYYIRFYMDGGQILSGSTPYEVTTPYAVADIWGLKFEQSADTLYIVHNKYAPRKLTRTGHAAWTLSLCSFINGPLMKENDTNTTITLTNTAGDTWLLENTTVTATASSAIFNANHVGSIWGIRYISHAGSYTDFIDVNISYTSESYRVFGDWEVIVDPVGPLDSGNVYIEKSVDEGVTWFKVKTIAKTDDDSSTRTYTSTEDEPCLLRITRPDAVNDALYVTINVTGAQLWACFKISGYTSSTVVTAVMQDDNNFNKPGVKFKSWAEGNWSEYRGWPGTVAFYQNRLVFGGTTYEPHAFWMSVVDDYENFERNIPLVDDNAIYQRLTGRSVNAIKWMVPMKSLTILTDGAEWVVSPGTDGTLTPTSIKIENQTHLGSSSQVEPVTLDNSVLFCLRNGYAVRSMVYDYMREGYQGKDMSVMASHLLDGYSIVDWALQQQPDNITWACRSDGMLLGFTYHEEHDVSAWTRQITDGSFESVAVIPGDIQDMAYFIVNRTINGNTKRYVEMLTIRNVTDKTTFFGVDCGATQTYSPATTTVSGLSFLEGETVQVLADGIAYKKTVSSGSITLNKAATLVHVGLPFDWFIKPMQIDLGQTADRKKSIGSIGISVVNSQGGYIATEEDGPFDALPYSTNKLYSGDILGINLSKNIEENGQIVIKGNGVYPMHITGLMPQVNVYGK